MRIALIDYGSGNLRSAAKAAERAHKDAGLSGSITVTADPAIVRAADRIILPGQGAFVDCRQGVAAVPGLEEALIDAVKEKQRPFFGICVGMQILARGSDEGVQRGLGWVDGHVRSFASNPSSATLPLPHMGWNEVWQSAPHALWKGIADGARFYFVHSYHAHPSETHHTAGETDYGGRFAAAIARDNIFATQFHPEKSAAQGLALYRNFLHWNP